VSLPLISNSIVASYLNNQWVLLGITAISAYIMNAEIPLFSLKIKDFSFHKYKLQMGFLIASITMVITLKFLAIPLIILSYVLLSILNTFFAKKVV
jgi:CDP-diacylglycerol--serine O-phosphatidyltransferase